MNNKFPFGIDPAGQVPNPGKLVTVVIEANGEFPGGRMTFDKPSEPILELVAQVKAMYSLSARRWGTAIICRDSQGQAIEKIAITGWIPSDRVLTVRLEQGALPVSTDRY